MMIIPQEFVVDTTMEWDGKSLFAPQKSKLRFMKDFQRYKLYADKGWNGNGFGSSTTYYIVDVKNAEVLRYKGLSHAPFKKLKEYIETTLLTSH